MICSTIPASQTNELDNLSYSRIHPHGLEPPTLIDSKAEIIYYTSQPIYTYQNRDYLESQINVKCQKLNGRATAVLSGCNIKV